MAISRFGSPVGEHGERFRELWSITRVGETSDPATPTRDELMRQRENWKNVGRIEFAMEDKRVEDTKQNNRIVTIHHKSVDVSPAYNK